MFLSKHEVILSGVYKSSKQSLLTQALLNVTAIWQQLPFAIEPHWTMFNSSSAEVVAFSIRPGRGSA